MQENVNARKSGTYFRSTRAAQRIAAKLVQGHGQRGRGVHNIPVKEQIMAVQPR